MVSGGPGGKPYEIPNEMRDFAEKSVEQARKAFDGFMDAAHRATSAIETQTSTAQQNARSVGDTAVSFAEANMAASFAFAQDLLKARTLEDMMQIQANFAKSQVETLTQQMKQLGETVKTPKS